MTDLYGESAMRAQGPGWRNALDAAPSGRHRAACYLAGARSACSKDAAWSRAESACGAVGLDYDVLGNARWPNLDALEDAINGAVAP